MRLRLRGNDDVNRGYGSFEVQVSSARSGYAAGASTARSLRCQNSGSVIAG